MEHRENKLYRHNPLSKNAQWKKLFENQNYILGGCIGQVLASFRGNVWLLLGISSQFL